MQAIELQGLWDEGFAYDLYTTKSVFIENDAFGNPQFDNTYSVIGDMLYHFKYNGHIDMRHQIVAEIMPFVTQWLIDKKIDVVMPCPSSLARAVQPVHSVAYELARQLGSYYNDEILVKSSDIPVKNMPKEARNLVGTIMQTKKAKRKCNVLLIDDIVDTGATANECARVLRMDPNIQHIYFLALAKKRV